MKKHLAVCLVAVAAFGTAITMLLLHPPVDGLLDKTQVEVMRKPTHGAAPIATSGDNTYIAWWTNKTGNDEVQFRASTDGGVTFADKINLSNSTDAESQDVEIAADGGNVIVSWWERNQTAEEPVVRISADNGETFGPLLKLATNGTIGDNDTE